MSTRLKNKTAIITGASSGLGRAICISYAREGANVCCVDLYAAPRNVVDLETGSARTVADDWNEREVKGLGTVEMLKEMFSSRKEQGGMEEEGKGEEEKEKEEKKEAEKGKERFIFIKADVTVASDMAAAVKTCVTGFGRLDIMVNNAGISIESTLPEPLRLHETPEKTWDVTMAVNAKGVFNGCKFALKQMLEQEVREEWGGDRGWIVNVASIQGLVAFAGTLLKTPMTTNVTATAASLSKINAAHPLGGMGDPAAVARVAVFLASEDASWVTGVPLAVDGGYTAL